MSADFKDIPKEVINDFFVRMKYFTKQEDEAFLGLRRMTQKRFESCYKKCCDHMDEMINVFEVLTERYPKQWLKYIEKMPTDMPPASDEEIKAEFHGIMRKLKEVNKD